MPTPTKTPANPPAVPAPTPTPSALALAKDSLAQIAALGATGRAPDPTIGGLPPYVSFLMERSPGWGEAVRAYPHTEPNTPFLMGSLGGPRPLIPMRCSFLQATQVWLKFAPNGDLLACEEVDTGNPDLKEVWLTLLVVYLDGGRATLATCEFRRGNAQAAKAATVAAAEADAADWAKRSEAHAAARGLWPEVANLRVCAEIHGGQREGKTSKMPYNITTASFRPVTAAEGAAAHKVLQSDAAVAAVVKSYEGRRAAYLKLAPKRT